MHKVPEKRKPVIPAHLLVVNRLPIRRHRRLLERFGQRRMCMTRPRHILRTSTILDRQHALCNHLSSISANNVNAQYPICFRVRDDFNEALRIENRFRSRVGGEWETARLVLHA